MKHNVQRTMTFTSEKFLTTLHNAAKLYSEYVDTTLLFIFREKKSDVYEYYEIRFDKNNFMHLAGIRSKTMNANVFYDACLAGTVIRKDCDPRRDANTMYSKIAVIEQLLDLRNSKCYKIGTKNLVTRDNDFEMATGNMNGIIGYDSRITTKGTNEINRTKAAIPTTLLNNPITDYCIKPKKIMFILQKTDAEHAYNKIFFEIKKNLLSSEKGSFPDTLKKLISL